MPFSGGRFSILMAVIFTVLCGLLAGACNLVQVTPTPISTPTFILPTPTFLGAPSITPLPGTGNGTLEPNPCPPPAGWIPYTIQVGDTLTTLAEATLSTVAALITANCLANPDDIRAGEIIQLPMMPGPVPTQSG
ncbi:MAG: LysM peptidoglycan-binding domain-containing protein [Anaerolineae bacterium]|nr:LysM peptidoglycan-binding domain-containing protein [Anaerolineae bacterium]